MNGGRLNFIISDGFQYWKFQDGYYLLQSSNFIKYTAATTNTNSHNEPLTKPLVL